MTPHELLAVCLEARARQAELKLAPENCQTVLILPGKWGRSRHKRLGTNGPMGRIVGDGDRPNTMLVAFPTELLIERLEQAIAEEARSTQLADESDRLASL